MKNIFLSQLICFLFVFIGFNKCYAQDKSIQKTAPVHINNDINHHSFTIQNGGVSLTPTNVGTITQSQNSTSASNKMATSQDSSQIMILPLVIDPKTMDRKP